MSKVVTITIEDSGINTSVNAEDVNVSIAPKINFNFRTKITPAQYKELYESIQLALSAMNIDS